jgi:hypothetical protein
MLYMKTICKNSKEYINKLCEQNGEFDSIHPGVCGNNLDFYYRQNTTILTRVHSFSSLFYDRSKASSKASSPHSAI